VGVKSSGAIHRKIGDDEMRHPYMMMSTPQYQGEGHISYKFHAMIRPLKTKTIENREAEVKMDIQEEIGKGEKCQGEQQDHDEKLDLDPDQSTIMYSAIRPGNSVDVEKALDSYLSMDEIDEMDDGVSIRAFILVSLEFLKNCIYFLRYSTKPSTFGMISFLVYLMK
jgi:hypothetical protein